MDKDKDKDKTSYRFTYMWSGNVSKLLPSNIVDIGKARLEKAIQRAEELLKSLGSLD